MSDRSSPTNDGSPQGGRSASQAEPWRRFAVACRGRSPLYARLSLEVAADPVIVRMLDHAPTRQLGHPTLLFAAVHDLLLAGTYAPDLAAHYPSLAGGPPPDRDPWPAFRAFCTAHRDELEERIRTRRTQTNEVARATPLLLALLAVHEDVGRPVAWIDVGTSAGLTLRLDHYDHDLGDGRRAGDASSPVRLSCRVEGPGPTSGVPPIAWRHGLDAAPVDVTDPGSRRWLEACVWPEQTDRLARLRAALDVAVAVPVPIHRGDAVADLPGLAAEAPEDAHLVVSHTWVLAYLSAEARAGFDAALDELGARRDLDRIGMEAAGVLPGTTRADPSAPSLLGRTRWRGGGREDRTLAEVDDHGRWVRWHPQDDPAAPTRDPTAG
jgi:hypothetical protein